MNKMYELATTDFAAKGMNGFSAMLDPEVKDLIENPDDLMD